MRTMKWWLMCPGQGKQSVELLSSIPTSWKQQVKDLTGKPFPSQPDQLIHSRDIQLAIFLSQAFAIDQLKEAGVHPYMVSGQSIGTFAAAYAAEVCDLPTAIQLVSARADRMEQLYPKDYGMAAVIGWPLSIVKQAVKECYKAQDPVYISNHNAATQFTLSGSCAGIQEVLKTLAQIGGGHHVWLSVPVPSHCPLMQPVVDCLLALIEQMTFSDPICPYLTNVTGLPVTKKEEVVSDLIQNVAHPVLWDALTNVALEMRPSGTIELCPGSVLSQLLKPKLDKQMPVLVWEELGFEGMIYMIQKWKERLR